MCSKNEAFGLTILDSTEDAFENWKNHILGYKHGMCGKKILQPIKNAALVCKRGICNDILSSERNGNFILKCPKKGG